MPKINQTSQAVENEADEADILNDQDDTVSSLPDEDDNMGAGGTDKLAVNEPNDFIRGEVDVKDQMDRASFAITKRNNS